MNKNLLNSFLYKDYKKDLFENVKDFTIGDARDNYLLFATAVRTPLDGVHINQSHDWAYNLQNKWDDDWNRMCPLNFFCISY